MLSEPRLNSPEPRKETFQVQKVFIKNIHSNQKPAEIQAQIHGYFAQFGQIIDFKVFQNNGSLTKKEMFAFISYKEEESVLELLNRAHHVQGRQVRSTADSGPRQNPGKGKDPEVRAQTSKKVICGGDPPCGHL